MQDAIIMYENGKAIGGEGHPTDADDITFNNTGTDLDSENVEDAIKEVNEKYSPKSVSVTANGTKTNAQLFNELFALLDSSKITTNSALKMNEQIYSIQYIGTFYKFANVLLFGSSYDLRIEEALVRETGSVFRYKTGTSNYQDGSSAVPTSGTVYTIFY